MVGPKPSRSLHGKTIYLDLFGYRHVAEFEKNLQLLGAVIEKCFSKEVSHVITNRATTVNSQARSTSRSVTAEAAIASPLSLSPFTDSGGNQSPFTISPALADAVGRPMTRGQAIVEKAMLSRKRGSTNVVECAQQWNIKVIHIDAAVKWMKKEIEALKAQKQEKKPKVMHFTRPYIKFEESRCCFCPEFKILAGFPSLMFNGPHRTCPFDQFAQPCSVENAGNQADISPHQKTSADLASEADHRQIKDSAKLSAKLKRKKSDKEKRKFAGRPDITALSSKDEKLMTAGELQKLKNHRMEAARQKGFCEICDVKYDNMLKHLRTEKHKSYVEDVGNYQALDELISEIRDQTIFQMVDPMDKVTAPSPTVSSQTDEHEVNILCQPSASLSSHFKIKGLPEWSNSCSAFFSGGSNNGEVHAATIQQSITNGVPKPQATVDETEPNEPGINHCAAEKTPNRHNPLEQHSRFNEQKSNNIRNSASFDRNTVNDERNIDNLADFGDYKCENLTTGKADNTLRPDNNIPGKLDSGASWKMNVESMSSHACAMQQSDNCELDSEEVSSEIPVIQSMRHAKETCKMDSGRIHVSAEPSTGQPITFTPEGDAMNSGVALSEFPILQLQQPNHTDQLQSQLSCHTSVTGSSYKCRKRCHTCMTGTPLKCHKHHQSDMAGSSLKCQKLPLPKVVHFHQESLGSLEKCFFDGCKSQKRKRIKFSRAVSVLTNRSMLELFASDTSSNFEGFTEVNEQVVTDLSYEEVSEAVLSIDSDFEWPSASSDFRLNSHSTYAATRTSTFPENPVASIERIITSVTKGCSESEVNLKMAHYSETPMTHSKCSQNVLTIVDLSNLGSDSECFSSNNASLNFTGVFNRFRKDTPVSFTDSDGSLCRSQQEDILTYLDKDASELLVKSVSLNENCCSLSLMKDESGLNQLSVDNKSSSVIAVNAKLNQFPANVKLPLTLTNAKNTVPRSWQPVVSLRKCDDWERGCDGDEEEQMSVSGSHSAVQDELLTSRSSEVFSLVEASNGFHKLRRKLNFSHVNDGQPSGLEEKTSSRKKAECSGIMKSVLSENLSASSMSSTDVLCCRVEMPEATNVGDLVGLESNGEVNVEEVLATDIPRDEQILCSESSTVEYFNRNSVASHISDMIGKHETCFAFNEGEHAQEISSNCTTASGNITAVKSNKTVSHNVISVGEIPMQTDDPVQISNEVRNAIVSCNLKARKLMGTGQDFVEKGADSNVMGKTQLKFCYEKIRNNKIWQPVVMLDRFSVKRNILYPRQPNVSISGRSDAGHVAKMPSIFYGMISSKPLSSFHSVFILADALGSETPFAHDEEASSIKGKISHRRLVVLLNRCDSQLTDSCVDVSKQKMPPSKAGLLEKQNLLDIKSRDGCLVNMTSLINHRKHVTVAVDLNRNSNTSELRKCEVKDVGTLGYGHGASEKLTARICLSRTFENSNHLRNSFHLNAKKKLTNADVSLKNTCGTDAISDCAEEPLEAARKISLQNAVLMRNSDVQIVSSDSNSYGQSYNMNSESSEISDGQKVKRSRYFQLNRSLSRKYLDWSKPETYESSNNSKLQWASKTNSNECRDLFKKNAGSSFPYRKRNFNHFLPRSKADWSKTSSPERKSD